MRMAFQIGLVFVSLFVPLARQTSAQGSFQNLDFEGTTIQPGSTPRVASSLEAFPGWTLYFGASVQSEVYFNVTSLGETQITLLDTNRTISWGAIEGKFGVELYGGILIVSGQPVRTDASIAQVGAVPPTAQALHFKGDSPKGGQPLLLLVGGQSLAYVPVSDNGTVAEYAADITAFRGQTVELRFTAVAQNNIRDLDSIVFSNQSIPEPGSAAMVAAAFAILGFLGRRRT